MKIGIHTSKGSFSDRWIEYCKSNTIDYKEVNAYDSDIVEQLSDCDAFMWHHSHGNYKDMLFAKQLLYSLQKAGKKVFPDFDTTWHFDDKVGQKYLLEAIGAPMVPSYVFYTKKEALDWIDNHSLPVVFKLRGGAGSSNVKLITTKRQARNIINCAFGRGLSQFDRIGHLKERFNKFRAGKDSFLGVCKGIGRLFVPTEFAKMHAREKGYVYFQQFIPDNKYDIRVVVTGDKACAIKRLVRPNDFRASGSGCILYNKAEIDEKCVEIAFKINEKLTTQSLALDFVFDQGGRPLIVELSYGYVAKGYDACPGYWSSDMEWHTGEFNPYAWQIENLIK